MLIDTVHFGAVWWVSPSRTKSKFFTLAAKTQVCLGKSGNQSHGGRPAGEAGNLPRSANSPMGVRPRWWNTQRCAALCGSGKRVRPDCTLAPGEATPLLKGWGTNHSVPKGNKVSESMRGPALIAESGAKEGPLASLASDRAGCKVPSRLLWHWTWPESWRGESYLFLIYVVTWYFPLWSLSKMSRLGHTLREASVS